MSDGILKVSLRVLSPGACLLLLLLALLTSPALAAEPERGGASAAHGGDVVRT